jgi:hypothetical protein
MHHKDLPLARGDAQDALRRNINGAMPIALSSAGARQSARGTADEKPGIAAKGVRSTTAARSMPGASSSGRAPGDQYDLHEFEVPLAHPIIIGNCASASSPEIATAILCS